MDNNSLYKTKDFKHVFSVHLMLGPACNMFCRHCSQMPEKTAMKISDKLSLKTIMFLDNFIKDSVKRKRNIRPSFIYFWGGEPLLHWDFIKDFVEYFTEKYDILQNDNFRFRFITNGLLLNDDIVDFVNKYEIGFGFSYDAPYPFAVRGYVPDKVCDYVNKVHKKLIMSCFSAYNDNWYLGYKCVKEKFPNSRYNFGFDLMQTFDLPQDIYNFDFNRVRKGFKMLRIAAQLGNKDCLYMIYEKLMRIRLVDSDKDYIKHNYNLRNCISGYYYIPVTLDGKISICHNSSEFIGTLDDSLDTIFNCAVNKASIEHNKNKACSICEHRDICPGPCHNTLRDKCDNFAYCDLYRKRIFKEFKDEMCLLGSPLSDDDKNWFMEENKNTDSIVQQFLIQGSRNK